MASKKLDLGQYKTSAAKVQHTHDKYTSYLENDAVNTETAAEKNQPVSKEPIIGNEESVKAGENAAEDISKRINMAFSQQNYGFIQEMTDRLGLTAGYFVSELIKKTDDCDVEKYLNAQPVRMTKNFVHRRKGMPAKRINLRFDGETYSKMNSSSEKLGLTLTQYVNSVLNIFYSENLAEQK